MGEKTTTEINLVIKVCPVPGCEAVFHNTPKKQTKCIDCGGNIIMINAKTYWSKFANSNFQYDYQTGDYYYPKNLEII